MNFNVYFNGLVDRSCNMFRQTWGTRSKPDKSTDVFIFLLHYFRVFLTTIYHLEIPSWNLNLRCTIWIIDKFKCSSIAGNFVALGIMKYFKVEAESSNITLHQRPVDYDCVQVYPHVNESHEKEKLSSSGFIVLISVISGFHVIATIILYCGITGKYKKGRA